MYDGRLSHSTAVTDTGRSAVRTRTPRDRTLVSHLALEASRAPLYSAVLGRPQPGAAVVPVPRTTRCSGDCAQCRLWRLVFCCRVRRVRRVARGAVAAVAEAAECIDCDGGWFQSASNATACIACELGYFCPQGASAALPCPSGRYQNRTKPFMTSAEDCIACPAGSSCATGSIAPALCAPAPEIQLIKLLTGSTAP